MTGVHGLAALRQAMTDYLTAQGVESMTAWPKDRVAEAFLRGGPEGFAVEKWSVGETGFDRESGSFRGKLQAVCRGMLTAVTSESGALVGFRVKGEVKEWNE